jgi:DNA-binding transcriptional MocR family regulator
LESAYEEMKGKGLKLDMSRGKPSGQQLDLSMGLLDVLNSSQSALAADGTDCRNYGGIDGLPEARKLLGDMIGVPADNMLVGGNASLTIMFDIVSRSMTHGVMGSTPWCRLGNIKFLCPAPGYDRHFSITEFFGIEMITIPMTAAGPDMDMVEQYVNEDKQVKGIWCVPTYSNPQGISYSDETVMRFAALEPAAEDFRIFWDNAYVVHHLYEEDQDVIPDIVSACEKAGHPDMVYEFCSTSKISFAGSGIAGVASSRANLDYIRKSVGMQTIGPDKLNQLRHIRYFKDIAGIRAHMKKQADTARPKFQAVLDTLERELAGLEIGSWSKPKGGYFIAFDALDGCAGEIVSLCKEAGVVLTGAGASYPYGKDPRDSNIRIAPTFPTAEELRMATDLFVLCVKLASVRKMAKT